MASRRNKSTIVRAFETGALLGIRAGFRTAERIAPELGARWAEWLWFRLPPAPRPRDPAPAGEPFTVRVAGQPVVGRAWGTGQAVYLVHGWGGSGAQLGALVEPLVRAGFRVIGFDSPGHGGSGPSRFGRGRSSIPEFATALKAVVSAHGPAYAVIAHSLGAPAVAVAIREGLATKRAVFIAPSAGPTPYTYLVAERLGFGERVRRRMIRRVEATVGRPFGYFDVPPVASDVGVPPTLVIHDRDDPQTAYADGQAIAAAWPDSRLVTTNGLGHHRILRDPAVLDTVVGYLAESPAGAAQPASPAGAA